jgi:hypothetical protein
MRPMLASAALRQLSPRKMLGKSSFPPHRIPSYRDESPMRNRSGSVKRKSDEGFSYAHVANRAVASNNGILSAGNLEELNFNISSVSSLCDKIDGSLSTADDGPVKTVLQDISNAIRLVNKNHEVIARSHNEKPNRYRLHPGSG